MGNEAALGERPQEIVEPIGVAFIGRVDEDVMAALYRFMRDPAGNSEPRVRAVGRQNIEVDPGHDAVTRELAQ